MSHACFSCGAPTATGIRFPGRYSDLQANRRAYLWYCADHAEEALQRRDKAMGKITRDRADDTQEAIR